MSEFESVVLKDNEVLVLRIKVSDLSPYETEAMKRSIPKALNGRVLIVDSSIDITTIAKE